MSIQAYKETFPCLADAAYVKGTRMKFAGDNSTVTVAGASDEDIGCLSERTLVSQNYRGTIIPRQTDDAIYMVASKAIAKNVKVYAAAAGQISDSGTIACGWSLEAASGAGGLIAVSRIPAMSGRSGLTTDAAAVYNVRLTELGVTATMALLGASAGTPAGAFGLTPGTFGSASPKLIGEAASGNAKSDTARFQSRLPVEYVAGGNVTVRVKARVTGLVQVAETIDVSGCYKSDGAAGIGSDLCATAAQTLTATFANYDFTITPTTLNPGDLLDIQLTGALDDTGATNNKLIEIGAVQLLLDVKG
jgi:hypothetical protein